MQVINAVVLEADDQEDYLIAEAALKRIMDRRIPAAFTFKDKPNPSIKFQNVEMINASL